MSNLERVLVSGASGFIGGRLVEMLHCDGKVIPVAAIRTYSNAARLARMPVELRHLDIGDLESATNAVKDVSIVYHCAFDPTASKEKAVKDIRTLMQAALNQKISRFVHVSTMSVYEPLPTHDLSEDDSLKNPVSEYGISKKAVEDEVKHWIKEKGLPGVIVSPTIVYGPFSKPWTIAPAKNLQSGKVVLPDQGKGICNAVFIDDVCSAIILAGNHENALGQEFLINGDERITWKEFFESLSAGVIVKEKIEYQSSAAITSSETNFLKSMYLLMRDPKRIVNVALLGKFAFWLKDRLSPKQKGYIKVIYAFYKTQVPHPIYMPNDQQLKLYSSPCYINSAKAQKLLGYKPKFSFVKGMSITKEFVQWALKA